MRNLFTTLAFSVFLGSFGLLSCDGSIDPTPTSDLATGVARSCCGKSGDAGNSKGVGKYCTDPSGVECRANVNGATICSVIGDTPQRKTTFCTMTCDPVNGGFCGENASCTKDSGSGVYGCTPNACTTNPPAGCSA